MSEIVVGKGEYQISVTKHLIWDAVNDPQNDCATEGGALDKIGWKAWRYIRESGSVDNIISIVEASRKLKLPVIWTRFLRKKGFTDARPGSLEEAMLKFYASAVPGLWEEGTWDVELIDEVLEVKRPEDLVLDKPASSAFIGTVLERYLRNWKIEVDKETALQVHKSCLDRLDGRLGMVNVQSTSTVLELLNEMD
ncbi:MAG: cysteine hydrolase family protein [Candidatus Freyarchaeota archaeon]